MESKEQVPLDFPCTWWNSSFSLYFYAKDYLFFSSVYSLFLSATIEYQTELFVRDEEEGCLKNVLFEPLFTVRIKCSHHSVPLGDWYQHMPYFLLGYQLMFTSQLQNGIALTYDLLTPFCRFYIVSRSLSYLIQCNSYVNCCAVLLREEKKEERLFGTCFLHMHFLKSLWCVAGCTYRYVAHRQGEMTVLETYPSQLNTQVGRDGINDNQDIVPDTYLFP